MAARKNSYGISPTATAIEDYIRANKLLPGDVLPSETALCDLLDVSRSSVREAMRTLASLDVVEIRHGYGTYVGNMSLAPLVNGMILRMTLNETVALETLCHVVDTRTALDVAATDDLIAYYATGSTKKLHDIVNKMRACWENDLPFVHHDHAFHEELISHLTNPLLRELTMAMWEIHTRATPILGVVTPRDIEDTVDAHVAMIEALEQGEADRYRRTIEQHYKPLRRALEEQRTTSRGRRGLHTEG